MSRLSKGGFHAGGGGLREADALGARRALKPNLPTSPPVSAYLPKN
jgi:hypothetical protein